MYELIFIATIITLSTLLIGGAYPELRPQAHVIIILVALASAIAELVTTGIDLWSIKKKE